MLSANLQYAKTAHCTWCMTRETLESLAWMRCDRPPTWLHDAGNTCTAAPPTRDYL